MNDIIALAIYKGWNWLRHTTLCIPVCPFCGEQHYHVIEGPYPLDRKYGMQVAHCSFSFGLKFTPGAYSLQVATQDQAKVLDRIRHIRSPWRIFAGPETKVISRHIMVLQANLARERAIHDYGWAVMSNQRLEQLGELLGTSHFSPCIPREYQDPTYPGLNLKRS